MPAIGMESNVPMAFKTNVIKQNLKRFGTGSVEHLIENQKNRASGMRDREKVDATQQRGMHTNR